MRCLQNSPYYFEDDVQYCGGTLTNHTCADNMCYIKIMLCFVLPTCLQDFPYYFEDNVQHWLLWSTDKPLEQHAIEEQIAAKFPAQQWEHIMFVNPAALQSVLAVSVQQSSRVRNSWCSRVQKSAAEQMFQQHSVLAVRAQCAAELQQSQHSRASSSWYNRGSMMNSS
jgi:hypothetical protein